METSWILERKRLLLRDGLSFLVLIVTTLALFGVTLFLFRSFTEHRAELADRWAGRGQTSLSAGRPEEAIAALETALEYAPGVRANQLMLAQALSLAGHTEQATNYFLNLWETQPGDGAINLQLARLARRSGDKQTAVHYYRAATYGTWDGDGVVRRRDVRLELANYLIAIGDLQTARLELLVAATNAPPEPGLEIAFGDELLRADDRQDAMQYYQKAIQHQPRNASALDKAGRLAFAMGDYARARTMIERALHDSAGVSGAAATLEAEDTSLLHRIDRLIALSPDSAPDKKERVARLLQDAALAQQRLNACKTQLQARSAPVPTIVDLFTQWTALTRTITRRVLLEDEAQRDAVTNLIYETETVTAQVCGQPTDDDALLLLLAQSNHTVQTSPTQGQPR